MRRSWGLRVRVLAAAALIAAVSLVTFGVLLEGLQDQRRSTVAARAANDALNQAGVLERIALELTEGVRGYALTGERSELAPYERALGQLPAATARLVALERDPGQHEQVAALGRRLAAYAAYLATVVDAARPATAESTRRLAAFRAALASFSVDERREQLRLRAEGTRLRDRTIRIAAGGLILLLVLIALLALGAVQAIVGPVSRLQRFARELGAGRFATRLPVGGPPETAELAEVFNATAERLGRVADRRLAELDAVFRDSPLGLAFLDTGLRFLRVNEALAAMNRVPAADHLGRTVGEVTGQADVEAALHRVVETGEAVLDLDVELHGRRFEASYFPVRGDRGELLAVGKAMSDVTERRRAEAAREHLQAVTAALSEAVTVDDVADAAVRVAGGILDAGTAILMTSEDEGRRLRIVGERGLSAQGAARWSTLGLSDDVPSAHAARSRRSQFYADEASLLERFPSLEDTPYPRGGAYAQLPLIASGRVLGVLSVTFRRATVFDASERSLLHSVAAQTAIALARAQLYEREHEVAQTLQASLLPAALPAIEGLDLAALLEAGAPGVEVGGDFYDAFALADGEWGIAIGDVCGKGIDAAALTALARHTVRAAAHADASPASVLTALNRAVLAESRPGQFLTAIFARLAVREGGGFRLTLACGGHPPPVVLNADRSVHPLECLGTLLGVVDAPALEDTEVELEAGDTLLLYTDGLTEAGAPEHTLSTGEVAALLAEARGETAAETARACLSRALRAAGGDVRDDIALLVVQVRQPALALRVSRSGGRSTAGRTPAEESSTPGQ